LSPRKGKGAGGALSPATEMAMARQALRFKVEGDGAPVVLYHEREMRSRVVTAARRKTARGQMRK